MIGICVIGLSRFARHSGTESLPNGVHAMEHDLAEVAGLLAKGGKPSVMPLRRQKPEPEVQTRVRRNVDEPLERHDAATLVTEHEGDDAGGPVGDSVHRGVGYHRSRTGQGTEDSRMRNLATDPAARSPRIPGSRRGWGRVACVGLVVLTGTFTSAAQAQIRDYPDLNDAVYGLALELVHEETLGGKKVLVSPRNFFERGTERSLRLSAHLAGKFASALRGRHVEVVSGSEESGVMTLRGEWTIERGSQSLHLSVEVKKLEIEKRQDGSEVSERKVVASEDGRVPAVSIDGKHLEPDLESHALHAVRKLERGIEQRLSSRRTRYRMHMESFVIEDVAQPEKLRRRLIRYLRPAIADSRELTRVHSA